MQAMGHEMKYIVVDSEFYGERVYIFSDSESHADMAQKAAGISDRGPQPLYTKVVAAGFCAASHGKILCYGESVSLRAKARATDSDLLSRLFGYDD